MWSRRVFTMFYGCNRPDKFSVRYELRLKAQFIFEHITEQNRTGWQRKYYGSLLSCFWFMLRKCCVHVTAFIALITRVVICVLLGRRSVDFLTQWTAEYTRTVENVQFPEMLCYVMFPSPFLFTVLEFLRKHWPTLTVSLFCSQVYQPRFEPWNSETGIRSAIASAITKKLQKCSVMTCQPFRNQKRRPIASSLSGSSATEVGWRNKSRVVCHETWNLYRLVSCFVRAHPLLTVIGE